MTIDKRNEILYKAREKYISGGITRNITEALELYLKNDAGPDEQIQLFISSPEIHRLETVLEQIRPTCDDCGAELHLQVNAKDSTGRAYPTAWVCKSCGMVYYSDKTAAEWLEELRIEARNQNLPGSDKPHGPALPAMRQKSEV